jgi:Viral BACON domain
LTQKLPIHKDITLHVTPATVALGAIITIRGTNFSPQAHIGLTRDMSIPITDTDGNSIITSDRTGSFTDTVVADAKWRAGSHIIRAEDSFLHKSASFTILVTGHSPSLRPGHLLISTTTLNLGSGDQATNSFKTLTLANAGGGQISWQAAPTQSWLLISPESGTFASGESVQLTVAADRSNLQPGAYAAQALFTSNAGQVTLSVTMNTTLLEPDHLPALQLLPAVLSFTGTDGSQNPSAQVVTISNPGVLPFQWSSTISNGNGNWLSVSPQSGFVNKGESQSVVVAVNISTLLPGHYNAVITFTGQGSGTVKDSPQNVYVSLTVMPQCALQVSPGNLSFTDVYLQPSPPAKVISLNGNQGCTMPLSWSVSANTNSGGQWLTISTMKGQTPAYPTVSVNAAGLTPGVYSGSLLFSTTTSTQTLPVTFTMGQPTTPIMSNSPASMSFSGEAGSANPPVQTTTITNTGGGVLNWHITASTSFGGNWLKVSSTNGQLAAQQSARVNVAVISLPGLLPNTYTGVITISGTDGSGQTAPGSPQSIPITFTVLPSCTIAISTPTLSFTGVAGQANSTVKPVTISANGTCTHTLSWTASSSNSWISTTPLSGMVSLTGSATTKIGVQLTGLNPKTYTGSVTITAVDNATHQAVGSPQNVIVTLVVQPPCTLQAPSVTNETFSSEAGSNPSAQRFTIGIIGPCTGNITITPTVTKSWLTVTPASAVITGGSATFKVKVTSAKLPTGSDSDTISIVGVDSQGLALSGGPQTISVTETVVAPPSLSVSSSALTFNVTSSTTTQPFTITNSGGEPLDWTAALDPNAPAIVSLATTSGTGLAAGTTTTVNVDVNATGASTGTTFTTSITVNATDTLTGKTVAGSPATINVTINVAAASMQLSGNTLSYTTTVGVNPAAQSITVTNTGGHNLEWNAGTPSQPWLRLSPKRGHDPPQSSSTIVFKVNVQGVQAGTYTATVVLTPSTGNAITVTVTLTIN